MGLSISLEQDGDKHILRLNGSLSPQTIASLENELDALWAGHHKKVLLDFANVESLSNGSLQMLFAKTKQFIGSRGNLGMINIRKDLMDEIKTAGLDSLLLIYRDEREAFSAMT